MHSRFRNAGYERLREYPNNGALATRLVLQAFFFYFAIGIILAIVSLFAEKVKLWMALIPASLSFLLLVWALWRIIRYYLLLKRQEASGIPFDPEINLSFDNYMRVLVWLDPKGYNVRLRGTMERRPENLDFYFDISEDENADSDETVACDDDVDYAVLDEPAEDDDMARIENAVLDPPAPGEDDIDDDMAEIENGVLDAPNIYDVDAGLANNVDEAFVDDDDLNAPVANDDDIPVPQGNVDAVLDAPVEEN